MCSKRLRGVGGNRIDNSTSDKKPIGSGDDKDVYRMKRYQREISGRSVDRVTSGSPAYRYAISAVCIYNSAVPSGCECCGVGKRESDRGT